MTTEKESELDIDSEDEADLFCPALPPHLLKSKSPPSNGVRSIVGPTLPPNYNPPSDNYTLEGELEKSEDEDEDKNIIGPLPSVTEDDAKFNVPEMEDRMRQLIKASSKDDKEPVREAWMLELPSDKPNILALGLGPRQFRKKNVDPSGDRSVWTDTPQDKEKKAKLQKATSEEEQPSIEDLASRKRDEELTELVKNYDKKRNLPLIDTYKQKKAKLDESKPKERKPFNREEDLQVNRFDEAQKETIMKKARQLNDRFSSGNRKFL